MADLFREIEDRKEDYDVEVIVTFLEIYNEEIRDLLAEPGLPTPRGGLQIREDKSVKVVGLAELRPRTADEVKEIVLLGNSRRTQSPTHANETSSRSHAVLQVHVTQAPRTASLTETRTMGTLSIIDLAGSERAAATTNMGQRMVEGANINKSLLALGNCINALCESGGATRHIPYRNSKLTRLLKFSLGGNCKTVMIVCVAPTSINFDDTHNTLIYAERATKIKTKVVTRNVLNVNRHVGQYVEAINRLNIQVEDLKAQLAGKRDAEAEKDRRRKREAIAEVERAKSDLQQKFEHTQAPILDGAVCAGKIDVAEAKLKIIRARLAELDLQATASPLSADLEAERGLLRALAGPEELALKAGSALRTRVLRSANSDAMFEATLRAVSERRSDNLDDVSVDNVRRDAHCKQAEMEKLKAEASRDAMREAVAAQATMVVSLIGLVGRCTVMLAESSKNLKSAAEEDKDDLEASVRSLALDLKKVADNNDAAFKDILGHSASEYAVGPPPTLGVAFPTSFGRRVASGPTSLSHSVARPTRRTSSFGAARSTSPSGLRKSHRSPRKSLRSSLVSSAPYRRMSDKGKKKGVQWVDEVGQGDIDDGGFGQGSTPVISITAPETSIVSSGGAAEESLFFEPGPSSSRNTLVPSESEWEDEKPDGSSFNLSFVSGSRDHTNLSASTSGVESRIVSGKRPRASHLNPGFLKSRTRSGGSSLSILAETDEEQASPFRVSPLSNRNMNRAPSPSASSSGSSSGAMKTHRPPKSPAKRIPMTPKTVGSSKSGRRKSNIGPLRIERPRRRSSMIPQLSPKFRASTGEDAAATGQPMSLSSGPKRVALPERSPAKRPKRLSLLGGGMTTRSSSRLKMSDTSISVDKAGRPTWK